MSDEVRQEGQNIVGDVNLLPWERTDTDTPRACKIICDYMDKEAVRADDFERDLFEPIQKMERELALRQQDHDHERIMRAESEKDAERWAFLPLLHAMDIATEVMGAQTPQDLRRGLERRVDALIAKAKGPTRTV